MKPLSGVRIVAVEQYGAGPFGSVHLADLGAEVIKIEDPRTNGDVGRYVPPFASGEDSLFFETFNRNKRSLSLDISTEAGREVFEDLVRGADAVWSNLRGDVPQRLKLTYDDLKHLNPAIVCCSLSGFGMTGPRRGEPGYDYLLQGIAGWMSLTGEPGGVPTKSGLSLVDYCGGFVGAIAMLSGIIQARRDGVGTDCDVSLYDTAMSMLTYPATWHLNEGWEPERLSRSAHPSLVPFQNFPTADGWIVVAAAKEKFWGRIADALGHPEWQDDERLATFEARRVNRGLVVQLLDDALRAETTTVWLEKLGAAGIPCAPINDVPQALRDHHLDAREMIVETEHETFGTVRQMASPVRVGPIGADGHGHRRAPRRNEDADHLLGDVLGYDTARRDDLASRGAFGASDV